MRQAAMVMLLASGVQCDHWQLRHADLDCTTLASPCRHIATRQAALGSFWRSGRRAALSSSQPSRAPWPQAFHPYTYSPFSATPSHAAVLIRAEAGEPGEGPQSLEDGSVPAKEDTEAAGVVVDDDPDSPEARWKAAYSKLVGAEAWIQALSKTAYEGYEQVGIGALYADWDNPRNSTNEAGKSQVEINVEFRPLSSFVKDGAENIADQVRDYDPETSFILLLMYAGMVGGGLVTPKIPPSKFAEADLEDRIAAVMARQEARRNAGGEVEERSWSFDDTVRSDDGKKMAALEPRGNWAANMVPWAVMLPSGMLVLSGLHKLRRWQGFARMMYEPMLHT